MKKSKKSLLYIFNLILISTPVFAAMEDDPTLSDIMDPILKIIDIAITVAGVAFVIYLAYGAIKASLATGDPRGLEGARQTWVSALIGMLIVVGVWAILKITLGFFDSDVPDAEGLAGQVRGGIDAFLEAAGILGDGRPGGSQ